MATTVLISDIGGTNARFELLEIDAEAATRVLDQKVLATRDFQSLEVCISAFLAGRPACSTCVIAIAGLIDNHKQWNGSYLWPSSSEQELQKLGFGNVVFLNDLEAAGLGVTKLTSDHITNINPQASTVPFAPKVVISHGTGFGFSFVTADNQLYTPWHSETGSSAFGPKGPLQTEDKIKNVENAQNMVSCESMVSRMLSKYIYEFFATKNPSLVDPAVSSSVLQSPRSALSNFLSLGFSHSDALCSQCASFYCSVLGSIAGNWATQILPLGGVYLTGGAISHNFAGFLAHAEVILYWFFQRPTHVKEVLQRVPLFLIRPEVEVGLIGAREFAERMVRGK